MPKPIQIISHKGILIALWDDGTLWQHETDGRWTKIMSPSDAPKPFEPAPERIFRQNGLLVWAAWPRLAPVRVVSPAALQSLAGLDPKPSLILAQNLAEASFALEKYSSLSHVEMGLIDIQGQTYKFIFAPPY